MKKLTCIIGGLLLLLLLSAMPLPASHYRLLKHSRHFPGLPIPIYVHIVHNGVSALACTYSLRQCRITYDGFNELPGIQGLQCPQSVNHTIEVIEGQYLIIRLTLEQDQKLVTFFSAPYQVTADDMYGAQRIDINVPL
jgi:hypothetical protein